MKHFKEGKQAENEQRNILAKMGYITKKTSHNEDVYEHTDYFLQYNDKLLRVDCKKYNRVYDNFLINFNPNYHNKGPMFCEHCQLLSFTINDDVWFINRKELLNIILSEFNDTPVSRSGRCIVYPSFNYFTKGIDGPYITITPKIIMKIGKKIPNKNKCNDV